MKEEPVDWRDPNYMEKVNAYVNETGIDPRTKKPATDDVKFVAELKNLQKNLSSNDSLNTRRKLTIYQTLFPLQGGLSDIYYWHDDFTTRREVNDVISYSINEIADYLLER